MENIDYNKERASCLYSRHFGEQKQHCPEMPGKEQEVLSRDQMMMLRSP